MDQLGAPRVEFEKGEVKLIRETVLVSVKPVEAPVQGRRTTLKGETKPPRLMPPTGGTKLAVAYQCVDNGNKTDTNDENKQLIGEWLHL